MIHLHTTHKILSRYIMMDGMRIDVPLSDPLFKKIRIENIENRCGVSISLRKNAHKPCKADKNCTAPRRRNEFGHCDSVNCAVHHQEAKARHRKSKR